MKGLFVPFFYANPYQSELKKKLFYEGVFIESSKHLESLSVLKNIKYYRQFDFVHIHWTHTFMIDEKQIKTIFKSLKFILNVLFLKILKVKLFWTIHNISNHENKNTSIEIFFLRILAKYLVDKIIVHSKYIKPDVIKSYKLSPSNFDKVVVIKHGNYCDFYKNDISKQEARKLLELDNSDFIYLFFGMIREYKGIAELISIFNKISDNKVKLLIVGKVSLTTGLKDFIELINASNNKILGAFDYIPNDHVQYYINAADVMVLPYKNISTSGSLLLAMSFGKAVIIPDFGFVSEYIDSKGILTYTPSSLNGLINSMHNIRGLNFSKMGELNKAFVKARYNWDVIAKETSELYRSVEKKQTKRKHYYRWQTKIKLSKL
ncbi:glycosyltransferase [Pedobacter glucosidilyticus]|uniref:glycosyltransferase n=1 Tax=Pedobacter glucosidilyticus TaxID=1122941 RepID=UPI0026EC9283|nr:glycosyltransferase [Pedobacter glucosidilyticus]